MKYLMFIKHTEHDRALPIPQGLMDAMGEFVTDGFKSGILKDTGGLRPTSEAFRVRLSGGKLKTSDGPFTEAKEVVGGYALVDVESDGQARELAHRFMELHQTHWPEFEGECEVRPLDS